MIKFLVLAKKKYRNNNNNNKQARVMQKHEAYVLVRYKLYLFL